MAIGKNTIQNVLTKNLKSNIFIYNHFKAAFPNSSYNTQQGKDIRHLGFFTLGKQKNKRNLEDTLWAVPYNGRRGWRQIDSHV